MNYKEYLENKKEIYNNILEFLDNEEYSESNFNDLNDIFNNQAIHENKEDLNTLFHILLSISNNHRRSTDFFTKVEQILSLFKSQINQFFSNFDIFNIFKSNKRILLFLIQEEIIKINKSIANTLSTGWYKKAKFHFYFYPEIKKFLNIKQLEKMSRKRNDMDDINSNDFEQNRKNGENNKFICKLIQNDEIDDFIIFVNKTNFSLSYEIEPSIFETNFVLMDKKTSLIDYASFYGSIQIFRYLYINKANISPYTWMNVIHSRKPDMIHLLEFYQIRPIDKSFSKCLNESIKYHHNEITVYIQNNLIKIPEDRSVSVKYYNFEFFPTEEINKVDFYFACKYNNFFIAKYFLEKSHQNFDVNEIFTDGNMQHTALTIATKERNKEIIQLLLSNPLIDVNFKSVISVDNIKKKNIKSYEKVKSSLHIAVEEGDEEIVKLLLKNKNIDVNDQLKYNDKESIVSCHVEKTALNIAIEKENWKIVEILLQHQNIDVNKKSRHNDCCFCQTEILDRYIEKVALILAVERDNLKIVSLLLKHQNIDVNIISKYHDYLYVPNQGYQGNQYSARTALQIAIERNNVNIVQLLLKHSKIELNYNLFYYKCNHKYASEEGYKTDHYVYRDDDDDNDVIEFKELYHFDDESFSFEEIEFDRFSSKPYIMKEISPLFISVSERNVDITRILLKCIDIDVKFLSFIEKNKQKRVYTPLKKATDDKSSEIIHLLKKHGAAYA